jgi:hypothetical protein
MRGWGEIIYSDGELGMTAYIRIRMIKFLE